MRIPRIYQAGCYAAGETIELSAEAFQHVVKVLRLDLNAPLTIFDGEGNELSAHICKLSKKSAEIHLDTLKSHKPSHTQLHLVQGIIKFDKMDLIIQKAVELGVTEITPLITEYCSIKLSQEKLAKKQAHWEKIIISACEQCGQNTLPKLNPIAKINDIKIISAKKPVFVLDPYAKKSLNESIINAVGLTLIVGPEGGFSTIEVAELTEAGAKAIKLGKLILRAETAAIAAISVCQFS